KLNLICWIRIPSDTESRRSSLFRFVGLAGKSPEIQYVYCALIHSFFSSHSSLLVIGNSLPSFSYTKGSGKKGVDFICEKSGGNSPVRFNHSTQVLSCKVALRVFA